MWYRLLQNLSSGELEQAIMNICKTTKDFYPGTNVVALILETVEVQKKEKRTRALRAKNEVAKKEEEERRMLIREEYKKDPEKFASARKVQQLASGIGRKM